MRPCSALEMLVPRKCGDYGMMMERVPYLFSRDILNPRHASVAYHLRGFCETSGHAPRPGRLRPEEEPRAPRGPRCSWCYRQGRA